MDTPSSTAIENGHAYDVFEARRAKDGMLAVVCFTIDLIVQSIKEGRGVLPSGGEPEIHLEVTRPGRHQLRLELDFDTAETVGSVRMLTDRYLEGIGYRQIDEAHYRRGSRRGSLTSLTPRDWQVRTTMEITPKEKAVSVRAVFAVNTFGQQVISPEEEYWRTGAGHPDRPRGYPDSGGLCRSGLPRRDHRDGDPGGRIVSAERCKPADPRILSGVALA